MCIHNMGLRPILFSGNGALRAPIAWVFKTQYLLHDMGLRPISLVLITGPQGPVISYLYRGCAPIEVSYNQYY